MLNKKDSFKKFIKGNGFYVLTGIVLMAVVVTAMIVPKKGESNVAKQPEQHSQNPVAVAEDISDLRVPTIEPRMDVEDEQPITEEVNKEQKVSEESNTETSVVKIQDKEVVMEEELVSETFSSTTVSAEEIFHGDDDLFAWPIEANIIYGYSDNDIGKSFMNPTLERTMRSFGLFLKTEEQSKVAVAAQGKVVSITQYPTTDISNNMDYPQVGTAVIVDHGNNWKTVYGLHTGEATVKIGESLETGDIVGMVGKPSRDFSLTGANLYFQVLKNDLPVNPEDMLE